MARQTLGRGLSALLGEDTVATTDAPAPTEIDIDLIEPNPQQPRTRFGEAQLEELAKSIRSNGVVQPIVVRKQDGVYQIIAGERRWRASQRAGLRKIPAVVRDIPDEKLLELALVENIQRQELNAIEEANAYRKLIEHVGLTQEMLSERVGKERSVIASTLRLLKLPNDIQRLITEGYLTAGHGRALLLSDDHQHQRIVANTVVDMGLSVRETEKAIKRLIKHGTQTKADKALTPKTDPNTKAAETRLMRHLGTGVKIHPGKKGGGKIEIEYYSTDDLDRLYQIILKQ
jgi:ParB family chromosome partitioning protein